MRRLEQVVDPLAERLLELRTVGATQWVLRTVGAAATVLALLLALGVTGLFAHVGGVVVSLAVAVALLAQLRSPDSDLGLAAPAAILLALIAQGEVTMARAAGTGLALLLAHSAFALAATIPVHGEFGRGARRLAGTGLLAVLAVSAAGTVLVIGLAAVQLGPWTMVLGMLAAIVLFLLVLPTPR